MRDDKGTGGNRPYTQEATQAERRAMVKQDDAMRTYFEMAQSGSEDSNAPAVVGATPWGPKLPAPAWSQDLGALPPEPPIGEDIYALPDCGGVGASSVATEEVDDAEKA